MPVSGGRRPLRRVLSTENLWNVETEGTTAFTDSWRGLRLAHPKWPVRHGRKVLLAGQISSLSAVLPL